MRKFTEEQLREIIESHGRWLRDKEGGTRADLSGSDLSYSDLSGSDLRGSDLSYSDLRGSNLSYSDLRGSNLSYSNLSGSNLSYSDLSGSNLSYSDLRGSNLSGSKLDKKYYQVVRIGSRKGTTTYNATDDIVLCGCWNNYKGGTLDEFTERVESVYGEAGSDPNKQYYAEYMAAIEFFKKVKK